MPKMLVTLSDEEVRCAVTEWAESHHGIKAKKVNVSVCMEYRGHGCSEEQVPVVEITLES